MAMKTQISSRDWYLLNEYIDHQLDVAARTRLEQRLEREPELQAALESLRRVRAVLRCAPVHKAPRSFVLTPQMLPARRSIFSWVPVLGVTSVLAVILLAVSFLVQWAPTVSAPMAAKEVAAPAEMAVVATEAAEQSPTPVIIYWGGPPVVQDDRGRGGMGGVGGGGGAPETTVLMPTSPPAAQKLVQPTEAYMQTENIQPAPGEQMETPVVVEEGYATEGALLAPAEPQLESTPVPLIEVTEMPLITPSVPTPTYIVEGGPALPQQPAVSEELPSEPGGPILGISKAVSPTFLPAETPLPSQRADVGERRVLAAGLSLVQVALAAVAVLTGVVALILHFSRKP